MCTAVKEKGLFFFEVVSVGGVPGEAGFSMELCLMRWAPTEENIAELRSRRRCKHTPRGAKVGDLVYAELGDLDAQLEALKA